MYTLYWFRHLPAEILANINNDWDDMTEVHSSINNLLINVVLSTPKPDCDISNWIIRPEQCSLWCNDLFLFTCGQWSFSLKTVDFNDNIVSNVVRGEEICINYLVMNDLSDEEMTIFIVKVVVRIWMMYVIPWCPNLFQLNDSQKEKLMFM